MNRAFAALLAILDFDQREAADALQRSRATVSAYVRGKARLSIGKFRKKLREGFGLRPATGERLLALVSEVDATLAGGPSDEAQPLAGIVRESEGLAATLPVRVREAVSEEARRRAAALWQGMKKLEPHERLLLAAAREVRSWPFVKLVGEESCRAASVDADRALELARFTLQVADRVPDGEGWLCRIFAWAILSNAHRVRSDFAAAEEALASSKRLRAEPPPGAPEMPEPWRLLDLEASLRIELRQLPEALRLLDEAAERAPRSGPVPARLLCKRSIAFDRQGEMDAAITALRAGLSLLEAGTAPDLYCQLKSNLAKCLTCAGQAAEAEAMLPDLRRMQAHLGNGLNQIRLRWLEGKVDAGLGRLDRAIATLASVRAAFAEERIPYDEAQAGMELARLYLEKGRTADVKRLVFEMTPVFKSKGVHAEARKALALFREAVEKETATAALAGRVADYLRRAEHDPALVFQEAA